MWIFTAALFLFFVLELLYFKIANHFDIIDKPNQRSSHTQITLRGGGIIFPIALIIGIIIWQPSLWIFGVAVLLISTISFLDDILNLNNKLRIAIHVISVLLLLYQVYTINGNEKSLLLNPYSFLLIPLTLIIIIGIINAYNFMDGINGITILYSVTAILSLWYAQYHHHINLIENNIWLMILASLTVFGYYNIRKTAKTFAGDIGSISMALIICFLIFLMIIKTQDFKWLLLIGIYGLDSVGTITCRIIRKENIFKAHRSHFYQFLANERKWPHVFISLAYVFLQLLINVIIILNAKIYFLLLIYLIIILSYIALRLYLEGKSRLFKNYI